MDRLLFYLGNAVFYDCDSTAKHCDVSTNYPRFPMTCSFVLAIRAVDTVIIRNLRNAVIDREILPRICRTVTRD